MTTRSMEIPFPYTPYSQQVTLMREIFDCIERSNYGIFESPTGTGKSMSAICASLHWLTIQEAKALGHSNPNDSHSVQQTSSKQSNTATAKSGDDDDWLASLISSNTSQATQTSASSNHARVMQNYNDMKDRIKNATRYESVAASKHTKSVTLLKDASSKEKAPPQVAPSSSVESLDEDTFFQLPLEYDSDQKASSRKYRSRKDDASDMNHSSSSDDDEDYDNNSSSNNNDERDEDCTQAMGLPQIIYCSRTHSQISQFVNEIKNSPFHNIRCITLGSRKNLCINDSVNQLKSDSAISEQCLELQKTKGKKVKKDKSSSSITNKKTKITIKAASCPHKNKRLESEFADHALGQIKDIEELLQLGKKSDTCPYYATRRAVRDAQVICTPYNILLHEDLRESMGIRLNNNVVIFDEAHNLIDAINQIYSAEVTLTQLQAANTATKCYLMRFQGQLSGKNLYYVSVFQSVVQRLLQVLQRINGSGAAAAAESHDDGLMSSNTFIFHAGLDNINLFKLKKYIDATHLVERIGGYSEHFLRSSQTSGSLDNNISIAATGAAGGGGGGERGAISYVSALRSVISLLFCLTNADSDGRVSISQPSNASNSSSDRNLFQVQVSIPDSSSTGVKIHNTKGATTTTAIATPAAVAIVEASPSIKFVLFNPSVYFQKLVDSVRSVILLGGTLKPFSYVISSLFSNVPQSKVMTYACDHVVSASRVAAWVQPIGFSGNAITLTHENRKSTHALNDIFQTLLQVSGVVPCGVVVFFTSYAYMDSFIVYLKTSGGNSDKYNQLHAKKTIFVEPRSVSEGDRILSRYSIYATSKTSNSKGAILFCVMGGKLSEGINFSDDLARCVVVVGMPFPDGRDPILQERMKYAISRSRDSNAGKQLYEAICMKAVNQSIGRSIRHINDFAAIVLLDSRYESPRVVDQLPAWISRSLSICRHSHDLPTELTNFFRRFSTSTSNDK